MYLILSDILTLHFKLCIIVSTNYFEMNIQFQSSKRMKICVAVLIISLAQFIRLITSIRYSMTE